MSMKKLITALRDFYLKTVVAFFSIIFLFLYSFLVFKYYKRQAKCPF